MTNRLIAIAISSALISACGGSSSSDSAPTPTPSSNSAPVLSNLKLHKRVEGKAIAAEGLVNGDTLTISFDYSDAEGDLAGTHKVVWLAGEQKLSEGTMEYQVTRDDAAAKKAIHAQLTPIAKSGTTTGQTVSSSAVTAGLADLYFFHARDDKGFALFATDGTQAGTTKILDVHKTENIEDESDRRSSAYNKPVKLTPELWVFSALGNDRQSRLYRTNGTAAGTEVIDNVLGVTHLTAIGAKAVFQGSPASGSSKELWITDGTTEGTKLLKTLSTFNNSRPLNMTTISTSKGDRVVFSAEGNIDNEGNTTTLGRELYITDGTSDGTRLLLNINAGSGSSDPGQNAGFVSHNDVLYFDAVGFPGSDIQGGEELYSIVLTPYLNGQEVSAKRLTSSTPTHSIVRKLISVGNGDKHKIYMSYDSDGSNGDDAKLYALHPQNGDSLQALHSLNADADIAVVKDSLYYMSLDGGLYKAVASGASQVSDTKQLQDSNVITAGIMAEFSGKLALRGTPTTNGSGFHEAYIYDGQNLTELTTTGSQPTGFAEINGKLLFASSGINAADSDDGELNVSFGTGLTKPSVIKISDNITSNPDLILLP